MGKEAALQRSLVSLAAVVAAVGMWTFSFKKMAATYAFGILGVSGILLPDWEFFDRNYSEWFTPMPARRGDSSHDSFRFKFYPLRVAMMTAIYSFGLYKWWMIVSS